MDKQGVITLLILGAIAGSFLSALLNDKKYEKRLNSFITWCLVFGSFSFVVVMALSFELLDLTPTKQFIGVLFVGVPVFSMGLVLGAYKLWRSRNEAEQ